LLIKYLYALSFCRSFCFSPFFPSLHDRLWLIHNLSFSPDPLQFCCHSADLRFHEIACHSHKKI
jgi:hypothetical protein